MYIHIYFLTVFEIIFYLYYIMPYEKSLFNNFIDTSLYIDMVHAYNITITDDNCESSQAGYDIYNQTLHNNCVIYICSASALMLCILTIDLYKNYISYDKSLKNLPFISMTNLNEINVEPDHKERAKFALYYWHNSWIVAEFIKTMQFMLIIGIFEYVFFITVVNKYKIVNFNIILCNIQN